MSDLHPIWYVASRDTPEKSVMIHETVLIYLIKELDDEQAKMDLLLYLQQTFVYHHETWYMFPPGWSEIWKIAFFAYNFKNHSTKITNLGMYHHWQILSSS